jgi:biopolymer transport protein TolQ
MFAPPTTPPPLVHPEKLDPLSLMLDSSGVVRVVLLVLIVFSTAVWVIWLLKWMQLSRLQGALHRFERATERVDHNEELVGVAIQHQASPGARVVMELAKRQDQSTLGTDLLMAVAKRAIAAERQKASTLMPTLSSIASSSPFIGLFGTVWGIMDAFLRIGVEKSASLPVVAPAIGEALVATAFGLVAAIPATIGYNYVDQRIGDLLEELTASSEAWVRVIAARRPGAGEPSGFAAVRPQVPSEASAEG